MKIYTKIRNLICILKINNGKKINICNNSFVEQEYQKERKNILIINHYAGSPDMGMEFRPYYLAREWAKLGYKTTIIGASFSHLRKYQPNCEQIITRENIDGIDYIWIKTPAYQGNGFGRIINMIAFTSKLFFLAKLLSKEIHPKTVIASSTYPFDIYPASKIAKISNSKLVFETHDLWPLTPIELGGYSRFHPFIIALQCAEDYVCKRSNKIISVLPHADKHYITRGMLPDKYYHVPNGVVREEWENGTKIPEKHKIILEALKANNNFLICYFGGHTKLDSLNYLIDAAILVKNDSIKFILVGDGIEKPKLQEKVKENNLSNIYFLPPVTKSSISDLLTYVDCIYIGAHNSKLYQYGVSLNKLYDSMMSAKPIICAIKASNNVVSDAKCGLTIEPEDPTAIKDAIYLIKSMTSIERKELGNRGRETVLKEYEYEVLSNKFIKAISD